MTTNRAKSNFSSLPYHQTNHALKAVRSPFFAGTSFDLPDPAIAKKGGQYGPRPMQLAKIVATIGPTSEQIDPLTEVIREGMSIMRLNFSHATKEEVELRCNNVDLAEDTLQPKNHPEPQKSCGLLLDTRGPEIRTGKLMNDQSGHETIQLEKGDMINLRTSKDYEESGSTVKDLFINYSSLHKSVQADMKVLLDDGAIILTVKDVEDGCVKCSIDNSGDLRSRAGVNLPNAETDLPAMSDKDKEDIKYGMTKDIDYVAASFVQNAAGVREIRRYIESCAEELKLDSRHPLPLIISKIESSSALTYFDEILEESDGIMVARGDLGVEIPLQQVTNAQKEMVAACNQAGKPVIVATQMLESMAKNPRPTRAEVSDVTNAVYDGADAVMLSGETAKGKYPVEAVKMMNEIILGAERFATSGVLGSEGSLTQPFIGPKSAEAAIAKGVVSAAEESSAAAIIVLSSDPQLARLVSANRPSVPIIAFCENSKMARQLNLYRGIYPVVSSCRVSQEDKADVAIKECKNLGYIGEGDSIIIASHEQNDLRRTETMQLVKIV